MQNIVWKIVLILAILVLCVVVVYPPEDRIRLGKDLQGGTSLIYQVSIPEDADRQTVLAQTIEVLKERVNPSGVLDISMQPLGADRIEIVMPLPSEKVLGLRKQYETAMDELVSLAHLSIDELDAALASNQAVAKFGGEPDSIRAQQISKLQEAYNKAQAAKQAFDDAKASGAQGEALNAVEQGLAQAQYEYEELRAVVENASLDRARVVRTLNLPTARETQKDESGKPVLDAAGNEVLAESPRDVSLNSIRSEFPHLVAQVDNTVAAFDAYQSQRTSLDDPEDLMRLLRGAGVLEFRIAVRNSSPQGVNVQQIREQLKEVGPENTDSTTARWFPINDLKQWYDEPENLIALEADPEGYFAGRDLVAARHEGQHYLLLYISAAKSMTHEGDQRWTVVSTGLTVDQLGRPAVSFRLDATGGNLMARLTGPHVNEPMAIVLDGQVYTAPRLNSAIGNSGIIEGQFSQTELNYLTRVLAAGALGARLSDQPIAINTLGPSLGKDNLMRGLEACLLSLIITAAIMMGYYFFAGAIANVALLINAIIIFGVMALMNATFTLPGLAGVALSIAMAVDANVLIYERIREEIVNNKEDLRTAIRLGYNRAMSAIIDGNLTNLIVCVVLLYTATTEVKGFALTMMLGIFATLFTALFVTRVLYTLCTEHFGVRNLPMLATVFPGVTKALTPSVNWISKRRVFYTVALITSVLSLVLVWSRGSQMLDMEFRGGMTMTMQTRMAEPDEPQDPETHRLLLSRPDVEREIHAIAAAPDVDKSSAVYQLGTASVLTVGESTADFKASRFQIKVASPPGAEAEATVTNQIVDAIVKMFGTQMDIKPSLSFTGANDPNHGPYTRSIQETALGANIGLPEQNQSVSAFRGGVAIVVEDLSPPLTTQAAKERVNRLRDQPDFSRTRGRNMNVIGLTPADPSNPKLGYTSLAVVSYDPALDQRRVDLELWDRELAATEWNLVRTAFERGSSLQEISSFSPAIARTLAASAVVAIILSLLGMLVYIWVRFGSLRFSLSAIVALTHNVIICLGALALTHYLAGTRFASMLLLDEYRIDLNVIAALLTIIGYSLNDTIVILDRIRENRGKRLTLTPEIVNTSINQTFSRTVLTGGSTILASIILFVLGGTGIQPFAFTFLIGLLVGTYSSMAIAAPMVVHPPDRPEEQPVAAPAFRTPKPAGTVASAAT